MIKERIKQARHLFNYSHPHIKLNPCQGCINRGCCIYEQYINPGEYCQDRRTENDVRVSALKSQGLKALPLQIVLRSMA